MRPLEYDCRCYDETTRPCPIHLDRPHGYSPPQYDKIAWFDICKKIKPELTEQEFEELWQGFLDLKQKLARS